MAAWINLKPGSPAWLMHHECRLALYELGSSKSGQKKKRGMSVFGFGVLALMYIFFHFGIWLIMRKLPPLGKEVPENLLMGAGLALLVIFSFMLSIGLSRSVRALFERGDLDLLLSSPLSSKTIFVIRLAGIVFSVGVWFFILLTPLANIGLLLGQWRWLGIYPALLGMSVTAAALAMMLTLFLVKSIGVRRTLTAAQILGAVTGAGMFIISQLFGNLGSELRENILQHVMPWVQPGGILDAASAFWLPARALFGSVPAMAGFSLFSLTCFLLTVQLTHQFFVRGVQQAVGHSRPANPVHTGGRIRVSFSRSVQTTIVLKEWRLISRDPNLISQVLLQLLYITPLFLGILKAKTILPGVAGALIFLAGSLTSSLTWIIVVAEDAPELLRSAPVKSADVLRGKLIAAIAPVLLLIAPVVIWLLLHGLLLGMAVLVSTSAAMLSSSLIHLWLSKPANRSQFARRGRGHILPSLLEAMSSLSWAAVIFVGMTYGFWSAIPATLALFFLGVAWALRIERN